MHASTQEEFCGAIAEIRLQGWRGTKDLQRHNCKKDNNESVDESLSNKGVSSSFNRATVTSQDFIQSCDRKTTNR